MLNLLEDPEGLEFLYLKLAIDSKNKTRTDVYTEPIICFRYFLQ